MKSLHALSSIAAGYLAFAAMTTPVEAGDAKPHGLYTKFSLGANLISDADIADDYLQDYRDATVSFDPGPRLNLGLGNQFNDSWAIELDLGATLNQVDRVVVSSAYENDVTYRAQGLTYYQIPVLLNAVWTLPTSSSFKPYLGLGAGGVWALLEHKDGNQRDLGFAFQAQAGLDYMFTSNSSLGVGYKMLGTLDKSVSTGTVFNHALLLGITIGL
jgi:opacity protein-like surface antigen